MALSDLSPSIRYEVALLGQPTEYLASLVLTDYHVNLFHLAKDRSILNDVFICREQDLELIDPEFGLKTVASRWIALVRDCFHCWSPLGKLPRPVGHYRQWDNN